MKQQERGTYAEEEKCNHERGGLCCVREPSLKSVTKNRLEQHLQAMKYYDYLFGSF